MSKYIAKCTKLVTSFYKGNVSITTTAPVVDISTPPVVIPVLLLEGGNQLPEYLVQCTWYSTYPYRLYLWYHVTRYYCMVITNHYLVHRL